MVITEILTKLEYDEIKKDILKPVLVTSLPKTRNFVSQRCRNISASATNLVPRAFPLKLRHKTFSGTWDKHKGIWTEFVWRGLQSWRLPLTRRKNDINSTN